jgi:hypothetical protein
MANRRKRNSRTLRGSVRNRQTSAAQTSATTKVVPFTLGEVKGEGKVVDYSLSSRPEIVAAVNGWSEVRVHQIMVTWHPLTSSDGLGVTAMSAYTLSVYKPSSLSQMLSSGVRTKPVRQAFSAQSLAVSDWEGYSSPAGGVAIYLSDSSKKVLGYVVGRATIQVRGPRDFH